MIPVQDAAPEMPQSRAWRSGRHDPLLQELWEAKARLNAAAHHDVARLVDQARRFDVDAELDRLSRLGRN